MGRPRLGGRRQVAEGCAGVGNTVSTDLLLSDEKQDVRNLHRHSHLVHTRLRGAFSTMAVQEDMMRFLCNSVSPLVSDGYKDLKRLYVLSVTTLPGVDAFESTHDTGCSHLLQRKRRDVDLGKSDADNVDKPWRDCCGGILFATLMRSVGGEAFVWTLNELAPDGKLQSHTNTTIKVFAKYLREFSRTTFNDALVPNPRYRILEGRDEVIQAFAQQRPARAVCNVINGAGAIWEALKLILCAVPKKAAAPLPAIPPPLPTDDGVEEPQEAPTQFNAFGAAHRRRSRGPSRRVGLRHRRALLVRGCQGRRGLERLKHTHVSSFFVRQYLVQNSYLTGGGDGGAATQSARLYSL